jgi:pimeloyl-ACP methyl ester carboxylesterase
LQSAIAVKVLATLICFSALGCAQRLTDFVTPQPMPPGSTLVIGYLGGFESWDDENRSVRRVALDLRGRGLPGVFVETAGNHRRGAVLKLLRRALDTNGDRQLDDVERASARIVLYGQSWGGAAVIKTARTLLQWRVPVLLTIQVDSVGVRDNMVPPNVRAAVNFYQHDPFTIHGQSEIHADDPARTRILGNFRCTYLWRQIDPSASWARRTFGGSHAKMELDPAVWTAVKQLIIEAISQ